MNNTKDSNIKSLGQICHEAYESAYADLWAAAHGNLPDHLIRQLPWQENGAENMLAHEEAAMAVCREFLARKLREGWVLRYQGYQDTKQLIENYRLACEEVVKLDPEFKGLAPHAAIELLVKQRDALKGNKE